MVEINMLAQYGFFWDDLLAEADITGVSQREAFFRMYAELGAENGDCYDLVYCPVLRDGTRPYQLDGYALDVESGEFHIAICNFLPSRQIESLNADSISSIFKRATRFCELASKDSFLAGLEETSPEFELACFIQNNTNYIKRIRCIMFTNARLATRKKILDAECVMGSEMTFNIIDFDRFIDIQLAVAAIEPIELVLTELSNDALPFLAVSSDNICSRSYLAVMPGLLLAKVYSLYGPRLMEQNVRSFLQARTKPNKGIIQTASDNPEMFFSYNNGITATAASVEFDTRKNGSIGISKINGLQIVNGGQTTASLLYAQDHGKADLSRISVPMKLSVISPENIAQVVPLISRYANSQNRISEADFFSSHPFHIEMQQISRKLPSPVSAGELSSATHWFYERSRGQYRSEFTLLRTPKERKKFDRKFPKSQVITKTDLAKYYLTFQLKPYIVSLGAQKCFLHFAQEISAEWGNTKSNFDDDFYRHIIAKAIVFRWLDKYIGTVEWYTSNRGYKANIVTYTLAWLTEHLLTQKSSVLNFDQIWKNQSPSAELQSLLIELSPQIAMCIKSPPKSISNISEFAKSQSCWNHVQKLVVNLDFDDLPLRTIINDTQKRKTSSYDAFEFEHFFKNNTNSLSYIRELAEQNRLLSPLSDKALQAAQDGATQFTRSQRNALKHLFMRLDELGIGSAPWKS